VTTNFASRSTTTTHAIPADMFGINIAALQDSNTLTSLGQAGFTESRKTANITQVYATTTPEWGWFDFGVELAMNAGLHPVVSLFQTPKWLQPSPNPCPAGYTDNAPPKDINEWAKIAAAYVQHADYKYPGVVRDYEIWNEPELQKSFCTAANTDASRLATYLSLYAAAASAMKAQAAHDGFTIHIGGPVVSNYNLAKEWISALLSNSTTSPYVDFVSYHIYLTGASQIAAGMTWSQLYSYTQSGEAYHYLQDLSAVNAGLQSNPTSTPIYVTEFNDNWTFAKDCCRNDPAYGPLWNAAAVIDFLNTVYAGANRMPAKLFYYAGSSYPYFCLAGAWDANMDCNPSTLTPYPQFYAYKLMASPSYLGLSGGGQMAASVSAQSGLLATAFFTSSQNSIVILNPTATAFSSVKVVANNSGYTTGVGRQFLLNKTNPQITTKSLTLTKITGGFQATVSVPAYSIVAVTIAP